MKTRRSAAEPAQEQPLLELPDALKSGPMDGGSFNLLAFCIALVVTGPQEPPST